MNDSGQGLSVSVVVPTLNSASTLAECLNSIRRQSYPAEFVEIIIADGGSTDETLRIAADCGVTRIVENPLKTGEAGKSVSIEQATGEFIALVDSDNILDDPLWIRKMLAPFGDPDIVAAEPIRYTRRDQDQALTRYFAMLGMNDPVCLFIGNYDRECLVTGKWTGLDISQRDCGDYLKLTLNENSLPTIGANGFMIRRSLLDHVEWQPYFFDIDIVAQAVKAGYCNVAKVKCGIVHLFCGSLADFARKQDRRVKDFFFFSRQQQRHYPWKRLSRVRLLWFCLATLLIVPLLIQQARGWLRKKDPAWWYHVPACWVTLWIYASAGIRRILGIRPRAKSRDEWSQ